MKRGELSEKVMRIVAAQGAELDQLKPETRLIQDLGFDTIDIEELGMDIEEDFDLDIPYEDSEKMLTISDIVNYLVLRLDIEKQWVSSRAYWRES